MNSIKKTARIAGFLYSLYFVTEISARVFGRSPLIVFGDAAATASNITAHEWQFRIGIVNDLLAGVLFVLAAWALHALLKPVNKNLALLFLLLNVGGAAARWIGDLNLFAALPLLSGADYLKVFQAEQLQAQAMLFLNLRDSAFASAQIFYGAWLFPLGYLAFRSGFLPRVLGVLLMMDCFGVLVWFFQFFLFPGYEVITYPGLAVSLIAEVSLTLWLLIRGVKDRKPASIEAS